MSKKTIVHVITNFSGVGGAEMMLTRLIQQTQDKYEHVIISLMRVSDVYLDTLKLCKAYYALNWNGVNTLGVIIQLRKLLGKIKPRTVQCWMYHANVLTSLSVLMLKDKPKVFWGIHHSLASLKDESLSTKIGLVLSKILSIKPTGIIYCAHSSLEQHQQYGLKNPNSYVIANGVFLNNFQPNLELHDPCVIGFAGRYHTAKGYPYLFSTMAKLKNESVIFKIAGSGANMDNPEIEAYFKEYNLDPKKVELLDQISDMPSFYNSIDAFLMTSITEGFPNVLVEAMASGLPCISTDVGDAKYIVHDLGSIVSPRDSSALATAILDYINLSQAEKKVLKQKTRNRIEQNFSISYVSRKYGEIWESSK